MQNEMTEGAPLTGGPVDRSVRPVTRWTGSVVAHENGGFVAYGDYLEMQEGVEKLRTASAQLIEAAYQALWHLGTDEDRIKVFSAGRAWATDIDKAAAMLRAVIRATESMPNVEVTGTCAGENQDAHMPRLQVSR